MHSSGMHLFDDQYFRINFYMFSIYNDMKIVGPTTRRAWRCLASASLSASAFFQLSVFFVRGFTVRNIVNVLPGFMATIVSIFYMFIFHLNKRKHEILTFRTINFYNEPDSEDVLMIKETSLSLLKKTLMLTTVSSVLGICGLFSLAFIPRIFDAIAPLNESRPVQLPFDAEHFIDEQKYFYLLIAFQTVVAFVVLTVVVVFLNTGVVCILKLCTFFKIISHRLTTLDADMKNCATLSVCQEENLVSKIVICIKEHQRVIEYTAMLNECGNWMLISGIFTIMITLTFTFVQLVDVESVDTKTVLFLFGQLVEFAAASFLGQEVINHSASLSEKAYNCNWYDYPIDAQKLLMLLVMRSQRPCCINSKNVFILCNKSLATVLQTTTSYCMVLRQFQ